LEKIVVYPGTFDPVTFGHLDVIERSLQLFDKVIIAVTTRSGKNPLFSLNERVSLLRECTRGMNNVSVEPFSGLLVDFAKSKGANAVIRGLRQLSDFETEFQQATVNRKLFPKIETVFIATSAKYFYLNSTVVKEIASFKGNLSCFVPKPVERALQSKFS